MNYIKYFIDQNRQTGTTTALIDAVNKTNGYLIVSNQDTKLRLIKLNPTLKNNILTLENLKSFSINGLEKRPVFFDTDSVCNISSVLDLPKSNNENKSHDQQLNIKLTTDDIDEIKNINKSFFENELTNSVVGRIMLRKGIAFYKKLLTM